MKKKTMQLSRWAAAILLCSLILSPSARSQDCPCSWYDAVPPNPDWGLPPTLGEMFPWNNYDTEEAKAFFLVPLEKLQSLLPLGVTALAANSAKTYFNFLPPECAYFGLVAVVFWEHNSVQYGKPYNVGFAMVMVDDPSWGTGPGAWYGFGTGVITSEAAQWWGMAAFGWPWVVGGTHFQSVPSQGIKAFASADGELVMELEMSTEDMVEAPFPPPAIMQCTKQGYLTRAVMLPNAAEIRYASWTPGTSTLRLGQHPIAQDLRAIGLGEFPSIGQIWTKHMQGTLFRGTCEPMP